MPHLVDVTLRADSAPDWPDKCIVCQDKPDATTKVVHNSSNPFVSFFMPILFFVGWSSVEIPICRSCKWRFRVQRWFRGLLMVTAVFVAVWLIMPLMRDFGLVRPVQKLVGGIFVLVAICPLYVLLEYLWPPVFDIDAGKFEVTYQFLSEQYAAEFHDSNLSTVTKSDFDS